MEGGGRRRERILLKSGEWNWIHFESVCCKLGYSLHTAMLFVSVLDVFVVLTWMYLFVKRCRNWKRNQRIFLSNWMMNSIENNYSLKSFWNDGFYVDFCFVFIIKNILLLVFRCYHSYCRLSKTYIYSKLEDSNREHTKIYCLGGSGWCSNMHCLFHVTIMRVQGLFVGNLPM